MAGCRQVWPYCSPDQDETAVTVSDGTFTYGQALFSCKLSQEFYCTEQAEGKFKYDDNTGDRPNLWNEAPGSRIRSSYNTRPEFSWVELSQAEYERRDFRKLPDYTEFLSNQALVMDVIRNANDIPNAHKGIGANITYFDGSTEFKNITDGQWGTILGTLSGAGSSNDAAMETVWLDLDE